MKTILVLLTTASFLMFWMITMIIYTPACLKLKMMMEELNESGELTKRKVPVSWYFTNMHTLESWTIGLPKNDKYLKYELVVRTSNRIRICRRIMAYTSLMMIVCGFILLMMV